MSLNQGVKGEQVNCINKGSGLRWAQNSGHGYGCECAYNTLYLTTSLNFTVVKFKYFYHVA